jgi:hypothetical protein
MSSREIKPFVNVSSLFDVPNTFPDAYEQMTDAIRILPQRNLPPSGEASRLIAEPYSCATIREIHVESYWLLRDRRYGSLDTLEGDCDRLNDRWGKRDIIDHIVRTRVITQNDAEKVLHKRNNPDRLALIVNMAGNFALLTTHTHPDITPLEIINRGLSLGEVIDVGTEYTPQDVWTDFCEDMRAHGVVLSEPQQIVPSGRPQRFLRRIGK